ncbi:MAG: 16S rRNA processing protein RimM [Bacteroidetes bacterium]|nr:MAG: 16S rRNA processing protein RimM [Bacteroidota bacterium]
MEKQNCYQLGYIAKLHGFKGEVSLFLDVSDPGEYEEVESLFIDIDGNLTPFFLERYQLNPNKNFALIKLEGVDEEAEARRLLKKKVYLPLTELPELGNQNFYDHEVPGFLLVDENHGEVGKVVQIIDLASNPLIQVDANGKEVLIPLVDGLVQLVDRKNARLLVSCPEGLLDLYLGED